MVIFLIEIDRILSGPVPTLRSNPSICFRRFSAERGLSRRMLTLGVLLSI